MGLYSLMAPQMVILMGHPVPKVAFALTLRVNVMRSGGALGKLLLAMLENWDCQLLMRAPQQPAEVRLVALLPSQIQRAQHGFELWVQFAVYFSSDFHRWWERGRTPAYPPQN